MLTVSIISCELDTEACEKVIHIVQTGFEAHLTVQRETAKRIKCELDHALGGTWHCAVGRSFGSSVTHNSGGIVYLRVVVKEEEQVLDCHDVFAFQTA